MVVTKYCPVCGYDYTRLSRAEFADGRMKREYTGECGHVWTETEEFHKRQTLVEILETEEGEQWDKSQ